MLIRISVLVSIVFIIFSCSKEKNTCNCKSLPDASDKYNYPIKPGTAEWNSIHSTDSLFLVSQIPDTILKRISTDGLAQSCIENPLRLFQFAFSSRIQGRDELFKRLNCFQELIKRPDGAAKLFERYRLMEPCCIEGMNDAEKGDYSLLFYYTEILLTNDSVTNQLNITAKKSLVAIVIMKDILKKNYLDSSGISIISRTPGIMILSTIMETESYQPYINDVNQNSDLKTFTKTGIITSSGIYDIVLGHAKKFIQ